MRLFEIDEAPKKLAVFTFGRLNPPHYGHHAMINTLQRVAKEKNADWFLFVSSKTGDEKNPLTYEQKVWWIQTLFPETKGHLVIDPSIKTPLVAATWLYKKGYRAATFVAGEDDMSSYGEMIKSGNAHGIKNPDAVGAGKGFVFDPLDFAISPRLASATNARKNIADGDPEAFVRSILGPKISPQLAELVHDQLYPTLRKAMGLTESIQEARRKSAWEKMSGPFKGTSKDLDKSDERVQAAKAELRKASADYQKLVDKDKQPKESAELSKHTPSIAALAKKYATKNAAIHHQLNKGVKVEFEHTNDIDVATEIAMDHLGERLDYYDVLKKAEAAPKKKISEAEGAAQYTLKLKRSDDYDTLWIKSNKENSWVEVRGKPGYEIDHDPADPLHQILDKLDAPTVSTLMADGGFTLNKNNPRSKPAVDAISHILATESSPSMIGENFADGKGPGKPGDSQRHGIPKKATIAQLEKASHAKGRKGQLARWQLNMRRGKKANEDGTFPVGNNPDSGNLIDRQVAMYPWDIETPHPKEIDEVADQPYRFISPVSTSTAQKFIFQTDSGTRMQVNIIVDQSSGTADVGFYDSTDKDNPTIGMTGKGDAFRVFATVGSIVKQFVAKRKPPYISFSGKSSDAGRIKLYDMIAKNIGRYLPEYKLIDSGFANGDKGYTFKRVGAAESLDEDLNTNNYGGWISPKGKINYIEDEHGHEEWINNNANMEYEEALKNNWIRFATQGASNLYLNGNFAALRKMYPKYAGNIARVATIIVDVTDRPGTHLKFDVFNKPKDKLRFMKMFSPEYAVESLEETLKQVKGKWALVSRHDPKKVLQYYHGSQHPSKEWVSKVERRVHSFESLTEDESVKPRVYLDMDGVLADFFGEWSRISGVDHYKDINDVEGKLELIRQHPTFWVDLPLLPHARALIKTVIDHYGEYRICSKPLEGDARSKSGKMEWIRTHLSDMPPAEVVLTADKAKFAKQDGVPAILVDDYGVNINSWRAASGIGLKYDDASYPQVAKILVSIAKSGIPK